MRKKSKRIVRTAAKPLTAVQKSDIFLGPRLHFHLLISGQYSLDYICSVAGIFNFAAVIAYQTDRSDLLAIFDEAQERILTLIDQERAPAGLEVEKLSEAFSLADAWIERQNTAVLTQALIASRKEIRESIATKENELRTAKPQ